MDTQLLLKSTKTIRMESLDSAMLSELDRERFIKELKSSLNSCSYKPNSGWRNIS